MKTNKTLKNIIAQATPGQIRDILVPRQKWDGRIDGSSFFRVPSVRSFEVTPSPINPVLEKAEISRKLPPTTERTIDKRNNSLNRYMTIRIRAMRKALNANRPDIF